MKWLNRNSILSFFLAFVLAWFGIHELFTPVDWVVFVPSFLGGGSLATASVTIHGIVLIVCALMLIFDYHRRLASGIVAIMFAEIIFTLLKSSGLSDVAVRDIGLLGMAIANSL